MHAPCRTFSTAHRACRSPSSQLCRQSLPSLAPARGRLQWQVSSPQWRVRAEDDKQNKKVDQEIDELKKSLADTNIKFDKLPGEGTAKTEDKTLAIVTGAISIIIGIAYLAIVAFLNNSRGSQLEPPPPEAFGWLQSQLFANLQ